MVIHDKYKNFNAITRIDSGADMNCIQEGLVPTQYFEKTTQTLTNASGINMKINYKLNKVQICNKTICIPTKGLITIIILRHSIFIYDYASWKDWF